MTILTDMLDTCNTNLVVSDNSNIYISYAVSSNSLRDAIETMGTLVDSMMVLLNQLTTDVDELNAALIASGL